MPDQDPPNIATATPGGNTPSGSGGNAPSGNAGQAPPPTGGPLQDGGELGDAVQPCDQNDVEAVCDLDEPNGIEAQSEHEEDEPVGLLFTATAVEPDGTVLSLRAATAEAGA